ncbi:MAG: PD-(D/E)XK nuclease family protein [Faecalibacterium sp.]|nr:PD-(D/E)XK nuclease family protein [Ruminococcus sp.]MCM1393127.1 PD-(D/E)XK nuclease family protein [Ruminococcus sp.]MCM1485110.1 PD-(D/E)XK nuclease family protein [Faecalibacterium sp.]
MLQFIIGSKGSGKTTYLHKLIGSLVRNEKSSVMLFVPKQFTFETDSGILSELGPKDGCEVDVLSFSRLAENVIKHYGGITNPILQEGADAVIMGLALENVKDKLKFFSRHFGNIAFIRKMLDEIKSLKKSAVTAQELDLAAKRLPESVLREKMLETALIYDAYDSLVQQSFFDDSDMLTVVTDILQKNNVFDGKVVAIDAFSRFSGQELNLIERMLVSAKDVYITACTDDIDNCDESSVYAAVNRTVRQITAIAKKNGVGIRRAVKLTDEEAGFETYSAPELRHLAKNLYTADFKPFETDASAVTVCCAPTIRDECDFAARQIKQLMRTGEYRCRDITVVYRSADPYETQIRQSLKKYDVPIFEDKRQPIENEPLIIAVKAVLAVCFSGLTTDNLMRYAKTGLAGVDRDSIAQAENYALMWDISPRDWKREWKDNPDGFGSEINESRLARLDNLNETRKKLVDPLIKLSEELKSAGGKESIKLLYEFLIDNGINENLKEYAIELETEGNIELAIEQEQVWDILMQVFNQIAMVLGDMRVSPKRLAEIFDLIVSTQSLGKLPDGFDEVYICDSDRVQTKTSKVVFVLGANDGVFPLTYSESGLFGDFEKERIRAVMPDMKDDAKQAAIYERFMVYNSLCGAREKLFVSYSLADTKDKKLAESEIIAAIRSILPESAFINTAEQPIEQLIESEKAAFELMARKWNDASEESATLKEYFKSKPEYKGKMQALERAASKKEFIFEDKNTATQLFGKYINVSASKIENYSQCPFRYFCENGIHAQPRKKARLDPMESGSIVHFVLEKLFSNHKDGKGVFALSKKDLESETEQLLTQYIETYMGGTDGKSKRFKYLYYRMLKVLNAIISRLLCEFENSDFVPCDFELKIGRGGEIKPFRVELENGYVELRGSVDRVDKMEHGENKYIRVVDYKTGSKTFSLSDVLSGLGMQMLLYLVSIWRGGEEYYGGGIVPAGVLYLPARFNAYKVDRSDDEQERENKMLVDGKMSGMILNNDEVINGMDKKGEFKLLPLKKTSTKLKPDNLINLQQLGVLAKKMDKIIADMGNSLHDGYVPAKPAFGKDNTTTCEYCDFKNVCMNRENGSYRYIEYLKHEECLAKLEEGENNGKKLD